MVIKEGVKKNFIIWMAYSFAIAKINLNSFYHGRKANEFRARKD